MRRVLRSSRERRRRRKKIDEERELSLYVERSFETMIDFSIFFFSVLINRISKMHRASVQKKGSSFKPTAKPKQRPRPTAAVIKPTPDPAPVEEIIPETIPEVEEPIVEEEEREPEPVEPEPPKIPENSHSIKPAGFHFAKPNAVEGEEIADADGLPHQKMRDIITSKFRRGTLSTSEIQRREARKEGIREKRKRAARRGAAGLAVDEIEEEEEVESDLPKTPGIIRLFLMK